MLSEGQFRPILKSELSPSGQGQSPPVSPEDFHRIAKRGQGLLDGMRKKGPTPNFQTGWEGVKADAYEATRSDWGGGTFNPRTSSAVDFHKPDKHAVSVREPGQEPVSVPQHVNQQQFGQAMDTARSRFNGQLTTPQHFLGVFHDSDLHQVQIDPVVVTGDRHQNEQLGREKATAIAAATHSVGGAYHFASGNGVWPPHVKED